MTLKIMKLLTMNLMIVSNIYESDIFTDRIVFTTDYPLIHDVPFRSQKQSRTSSGQPPSQNNSISIGKSLSANYIKLFVVKVVITHHNQRENVFKKTFLMIRLPIW
jgi:hypothetical protein